MTGLELIVIFAGKSFFYLLAKGKLFKQIIQYKKKHVKKIFKFLNERNIDFVLFFFFCFIVLTCSFIVLLICSVKILSVPDFDRYARRFILCRFRKK